MLIKCFSLISTFPLEDRYFLPFLIPFFLVIFSSKIPVYPFRKVKLLAEPQHSLIINVNHYDRHPALIGCIFHL